MNHDTKQSIDFLQHWAPDGPWVLTSIRPDAGKTQTETFTGKDIDALTKWIEERQGIQNIYFAVNPPMHPMRTKAAKNDIKGMVALHVDIDPRVGEPIDLERQRAERLLKAFDPRPTVIIDSGGGYQGFWKLDKLYETDGNEAKAADYEAYNIQLEVLFQADKCHNIDRIMRLPGTINVPNEKKKRKGRKPALAKIVEADWSRVYPLTKFTPAPRVQTSGIGGNGGGVKISGNLADINLDDLPDGVSDRTKQLIVLGEDRDDVNRYSSRSEVVWAVLCELVRAGCSDDVMAAIMLDADYGISGHILDQQRPQQYAARQIKRAREFSINPHLLELNDLHAVIEDIGGKCRVVSEVMDYSLDRTRLTRQSFEDFRNRYMHIQIEVGHDKDGKAVTMPMGKWWLQNKNRRQYRTIVFAPGHEVENCYNLWKGFSCEAKPGNCQLLLDHILHNVCRDNAEHNEYILNWMARAVQSPDSPGQVAIVLRGRMGTGKSFMAKAFGSLWGRHFLQVSDPKHLIGSFNSHLRDCVVLFADEAFYAGDKKHESILKTMVTEETIMIEGKGVDAEAAPNYVHLMMASNNDWVVPAGGDERRFFVLDVGDKHMQDKAYFRAITQQLDHGGREAFLYTLLNRSLDGFDVRHFPKTAALQDQKVMSFTSEEQWWFEKLQDGEIGANGWPTDILKRELQDDYFKYAEQQKIMRRATPTTLGKFLAKALPAPYPIAFQQPHEDVVQDEYGHQSYRKTRAWFYKLPPLSDARAFWDDRYGGPYAWLNPVSTTEKTTNNEPPF